MLHQYNHREPQTEKDISFQSVMSGQNIALDIIEQRTLFCAKPLTYIPFNDRTNDKN